MKPTIGRIVNYKLNQTDVEAINRRRTNPTSIAARIKEEKWPLGAQAHIGNDVTTGQIYPMIIVAVWGETCVNGQVLLDGNDTFWVTSAQLGESEGNWNWPVIEK